jgi:peptide/nickel transport system ATP-binding protein
MRRGEIMESGAAQQILEDPQHDYTKKLVASAPALTARRSAPVPHHDRPADDLLVATDLTKVFGDRGIGPWRARRDFVAVDRVSFRLGRGTTLAVVGESGSGKTTLARMVLGLLPPTSGTVTFDGADVATTDRNRQLAFRRRVQPVFQNPYRSLDPRYSVYQVIEEPLRIHRVGGAAQRRRAVVELLDEVALPSALLDRRPRELSGGQRQRVAIARALAPEPELLVADEPVSSLDVSVRGQILALLAGLRERLGLAMLLISHDMAAVERLADRVAVMYLGRVVELAPSGELFRRPLHPYTASLLSAVPVADPRRRRIRIVLPGEPPSPLAPPPGCPFHPRCPSARERCAGERPELALPGSGEWERLAACFYPGELSAEAVRNGTEGT